MIIEAHAGVATWDGAGDNQAYLSGQPAFMANTGSVGVPAEKDDPEVYDASTFSALPAGPVGTRPLNRSSRE